VKNVTKAYFENEKEFRVLDLVRFGVSLSLAARERGWRAGVSG